ncbi:MAG: alpha/beta hydrolase family protein [Alphaproteobacteria bacterium]|nr:alpha/beta hydrolase family protein [Alphaproteobacteria bacterium]
MVLTPAVYLGAVYRKIRRLMGLPADKPYPPAPDGVILSPSIGHALESREVVPQLPCPRSGTEAEITTWQIKARAVLSASMGWHSSSTPPKVTARVKQQPVSNDIDRETFYLRVRPDCDVPVHLLRSRHLDPGSSVPMILYLAGSTSGVHLAWGDARVPIDHQRLAIGCDIGRQAAARGYLVACIEQVGFGEREEQALPKRSANRTVDAHSHALLLGRSLMGEKALDVSGCLDWILSDPTNCIDEERIFLFGHSAGGIAALYAAAVETRIQGVLASGSIGRIRDTIATRSTVGGDGIVPGILRQFETEDIVSMIAPRRFVGLSGNGDHIYPFDGVRSVVDAALRAYRTLGVEDRIMAQVAEGPHRYYPEETWAAWERTIDPKDQRTA